MIENEKNGRANVLKEIKGLCKIFGFMDGMLKVIIAYGRKNEA